MDSGNKRRTEHRGQYAPGHRKHLARAATQILSVLFATLVCLSAWPQNAEAAIYKCPTAGGGKVFQDTPCASETPDQKEPDLGAVSLGAVSQSESTLGMHPSWLATPEQAPQPAYCDRLGCDCASQSRNFRDGMASAVAEALYLEASWHRYVQSVVKFETETLEGRARMEQEVEISESACDLQMSQMTLKNYGESGLKQLEAAAAQADARGHVNVEQCDGSNITVCDDVDAYQLYQRVLRDLKTLKLPRDYFVTGAD